MRSRSRPSSSRPSTASEADGIRSVWRDRTRRADRLSGLATVAGASSHPQTAQTCTILAATDFSPHAENALAWAQAIARAHGASIALVHALNLPLLPAEMVPPSAEFLDELEQAADRLLQECAAEVRKGGVAVEARLLPGQPAQVILDLSRELKPDLIVLGTRGLRGLKHAFLGSTTERVVQHA